MKTRIIKVISLVLVLVAASVAMTGCGNRDMWDTTYTFNQAQIKLPDGSVVSGQVDRWKDYVDSDMIQVTIDGKTYLTFISNVVMIAE